MTKQRRDLLEIMDDRHNQSSTIVTSQLPVKLWHEAIGDLTLGDAILDRLIHNAHRIDMKGESMRKKSTAKLKIWRINHKSKQRRFAPADRYRVEYAIGIKWNS